MRDDSRHRYSVKKAHRHRQAEETSGFGCTIHGDDVGIDLTPKMDEARYDRILTLCLRLGAFLCFAGWTWTHLYWEGPYGVLLWNEATFALAERIGIDWDEFVGSGAGDGLVQEWIGGIGWLYLACTALALTVKKKSRIQMGFLIAGSGLLLVLAYAKYVASLRQLPMFVEHGGQVLIPVLLVMALALGARHCVTVITAMVALVMTFAGHGCYAMGWWPTPGTFYAMTSVILRADHDTAELFLRVAGVLDFAVCVGILFPVTRVPCVLYAAAWGFLTALARPVAGMSLDLNYWGADQFLHEAVLRAPHFLIPLYLFFLWRKPRGKAPGEPSPDPEEEATAAA